MVWIKKDVKHFWDEQNLLMLCWVIKICKGWDGLTKYEYWVVKIRLWWLELRTK